MALALGKTIAEIDNTMSYNEFIGWAEYYKIEPFGEVRHEMRSGLLCSVIANVNGNKTEPLDFMHFVEKPKLSAVDKDIKQFFKGLKNG